MPIHAMHSAKPTYLAAVGVLAALSASCAAPPAESRAPAPVPGQTVQTWIEELRGQLGNAVYVRNDGSASILITLVGLTVCENTRQACGEYQPNVAVRPGQTARVMTITPLDEFKPFRFEYTYQWRALP